MTHEPVRAGLIGLGRMGRRHARVLRYLDQVNLVAAVDPAGDRYRAVTGLPVFSNLDQLLHTSIDYAVLACPTSLHEPAGTALAAAGIPTLIEKPLANDLTSARRLVDAFHAAGVPAAVGYIERFNPAIIEIRERLTAGQLGTIWQIDTRRASATPARTTDTGVIYDLATHDIDLTSWLTGRRYTKITARTTHPSGRSYEDVAVITGVLETGALTCHLANRLSARPERTITITGQNGCLRADTRINTLTYWANAGLTRPGAGFGVTEGDMTRYALDKKDPLLAEHEAWRNTVLGKTCTSTPLQDGLNALLVARAALDAAQLSNCHTWDSAALSGSLPNPK